jgi:hypothetical protein
MAYQLQAFIAQISTFESDERFKEVVSLGQGLALFPLTSHICAELQLPSLIFMDDIVPPAPSSILEIGATLSQHSKRVVYVEAEYFGGLGVQAHITWEDGTRVSGPVVSSFAINEALRFLGVRKGESKDEFATLDLGRERSTDDWSALRKAI